ncbi:peptidoglycan-binding protein [Saccharothrix sp. ALI-22-I]|uniref:peptidoglycan-binding domain-containing protein n=1 Tax=Saccharothrix sp. ALI-22-I TaxID=1933778 RepID=UPI00097C5178|nr:peptidoglycan-binding domain-containing protein [Saccharothrix sp. ALI-22-I]ONI90483.1 peptidoglycan-binding protein [Saccharothrix sp. ALI-22-I]
MAERSRWLVVGVVAVALLGTAAAVAMTRVNAGEKGGGVAKAEPPETTEVVKGDIADQQSVTGSLAYGAERALTGRRPGTVTALPAAGTVLDRGKPVYWVDAKPVPLFYGGLPLYRDLSAGVANGPDVKLIEENLAALGHTGFGTPDEKYTNVTATAVKQWQKANGLEQTGRIAPGDVVIEPSAIRVASVTAPLGAPGAGDLMKVTGTDRVVSAEIEKAKQRFAKVGEKVELNITDGGATTGTVTAVTPGPEPTNPGEKAKITVTIALDDQAAAGNQDAVSTTVLFTVGKREGVLIVPVGALLALAEGGYAVEKADDHTLIPVETGLFAKGRVEVTGAGLTEGTRVVTTS